LTVVATDAEPAVRLDVVVRFAPLALPSKASPVNAEPATRPAVNVSVTPEAVEDGLK
jgi:hypothetical protein